MPLNGERVTPFGLNLILASVKQVFSTTKLFKIYANPNFVVNFPNLAPVKTNNN
jgi:hypothetical protein